MSSFISKEAFEKKAQDTRVLNWRDLVPNGEIWKIVRIREYEGRFGHAATLAIVNEKGVAKSVKVSKRMLEAIDDVQDGKKTIYFTALGQKESDGKKINEFEIVAT